MEIIAELQGHPLVAMAARVGRTFRLDPVAVLRDNGDPLLNYVRVAAAKVVAADEEKEAEKSRASSRRGGSRRRR